MRTIVLNNIYITDYHGYVPFVVIALRAFLHLWLITGLITRVIRRMLLVEQELLTLPEQLSPPSVLSAARVARSLVFWIDVCRSLFVLLVFFFGLVIVLSISRFSASDNPLVSSKFSHDLEISTEHIVFSMSFLMI